jgi:hypothetical protein
MRFALVKEDAKFGIWGWFSSVQANLYKNVELPPPTPHHIPTTDILLVFYYTEHRTTTVTDTNCNYFVITYKI